MHFHGTQIDRQILFFSCNYANARFENYSLHLQRRDRSLSIGSCTNKSWWRSVVLTVGPGGLIGPGQIPRWLLHIDDMEACGTQTCARHMCWRVSLVCRHSGRCTCVPRTCACSRVKMNCLLEGRSPGFLLGQTMLTVWKDAGATSAVEIRAAGRKRHRCRAPSLPSTPHRTRCPRAAQLEKPPL